MSNPYHITPGRLPAAPHPTPTSVAGYTLPNSKIGRAPIANPYDKFTQPEFDAWIGGITGALKRALGHDEGPQPQAKQSLSERDHIPEFRPIDLPEDSDNDGIDDSLAEIKARRAAGKGKARDPREGPGFGKTSAAQPIEIPSSDEEEEEEVEYSVLHQDDSDVEEQPEDSEEETEETEGYPWSTAARAPHNGSSPPNVGRDEVEDDEYEYEDYEQEAEAEHEAYDQEAEHEVYEEEAEYEEYDEEAESEGEQQEQGERDNEVIELLSDDEDLPNLSNPPQPEHIEKEQHDGEEDYEEDEEYEVEDAEEDDDQERLRPDEYVVEHGEDDIGEFQHVEHDHSFAPQSIGAIATSPTRRATSAETSTFQDLEVLAQDYNSAGQLQTLSGQHEFSYSESQDEVGDVTTQQNPLESDQMEEEFVYPDTRVDTTFTTHHSSHDQHTSHLVFVNQVENEGHLDLLSVPLETRPSPSQELSFDRELVEPAEEHYIQPSDEDTSFPVHAGERDDQLVQISDPWHGPREYAQDFYAGGDIRPATGAQMNVDHLVPGDEDCIDESQARREQEAEDDVMQPQDHDTAFLHDDVRAGPVEIPDPWKGPETYAQDYYSDAVNGALPSDRIDPTLLPATDETNGLYSSFLTPYPSMPSQPVAAGVENTQEDKGEDINDKFVLPPAPEGLYFPPGWRVRDVPIPADAEIFNVDDSDEEEAGNLVPITEYPQGMPNGGDAVDDDLEYVDKDGVDVAQNIVSAPEVTGHDTFEPAPEENQERAVLASLEQSQEALSSLDNLHDMSAFPNIAPDSASEHLEGLPSEGNDFVNPELPAAADDRKSEIEEVVVQEDSISLEKGQNGPSLPDDLETSLQQSISERTMATGPEATESTAMALGDLEIPVVSTFETGKASEETDMAQKPEEPSTQSDLADVDVTAPVDSLTDNVPQDVTDTVPEDATDMVHQDVSESAMEIDQSDIKPAYADEPPPSDVQDGEAMFSELEPIVEEVESISVSRAETAPPDLSVEELDHHTFMSREQDTHLIVGIVEYKDATASPRETPDRDTITVDVMDQHQETVSVSRHPDLTPPISAVHHSPQSDDLVYEDYASSVEVDELDEEEQERPIEGVSAPFMETPMEGIDVDHHQIDEDPSSLISSDVIVTTEANAEVTLDAPLDSAAAIEVSGGNLDQGALTIGADAAVQDTSLRSSLNADGELGSVQVDTAVGTEGTVRYDDPTDAPGLVSGDLEANVLDTEVSQDLQQQAMPEVQDLATDPASVLLPSVPGVDDIKLGEGLDSRVDELAAGSTTPVDQPSLLTISTPEKSISTNTYLGVVSKTPERYTPSPPKVDPPKTQTLPVSGATARGQPSDTNDAVDAIRTQDSPKAIAEATSPESNSQTQPMNLTTGLPPPSRQLPPYWEHLTAPFPPPPGPSVFMDSDLEQLRIQVHNSMQSSFSQTPLSGTWPYAPSLSGSWPFNFSAAGEQQQQLSIPVNPPLVASPKSRKKPKAASTSPKKGKKAAQHTNQEALTHTLPEIKSTTQANSLNNTQVAQLSSEGDKRPTGLLATPKDLYGQGEPAKDERVTQLTTTTELSLLGPKIEGVGAPKQEQQKPKRTYKKRKRDPSPGPSGVSQAGKADEKKVKRPTKRKSKLLELEGPTPGPSNGETIHVKARPKGAPPVEHLPGHSSSTSKETVAKTKKGLLSVHSASLPGSTASQTPRPEVLLIARAGPPGISHRHGSDHSLTIPPTVSPSKVLPHRIISSKKPSMPQSLTQTQPVAVVEAGASSIPESTNLASSLNTPPMADVIPSTKPTQLVEPAPTESLDAGTTSGLPESSAENPEILPAPTTRAPMQSSEANTTSSEPQTQLNITFAPTRLELPLNNSTVTAATAPAINAPSAPVVSPMTSSVSKTPASQGGTPRTTMRETRSSCRYHRISLPKEEGGPRVQFLVPGCAMTNDILMKQEEIVDHGLAPVEDAYTMIKDIESLDLGPDLIGVLRVLVGHDIFRDQELFYLPSPGEQLSAKPAFRRPTPSDRLESPRHKAGSPSYSSLAGSPTFHKSSTSISGSTSSLSALRKAQTSDWGSNLAPTDSEAESEDGETHSKASYQGSDHKGKGKSRAKSGRKSKLSRDPDFVPASAKRGVKRTRTEVPVGEDPSRESKKLKVQTTAPPSLPSPENPAPSIIPPNES